MRSMADQPNKLKHLEFIQAVIARMAANSFLLKGWSVTLVAGMFALAAKDADYRYFLVAYLPVIVFWGLDGYFLSQERLFRSLFDDVRTKEEGSIDFSMNTNPFCGGRNSWVASVFSVTLRAFYLAVVVTILIVVILVG